MPEDSKNIRRPYCAIWSWMIKFDSLCLMEQAWNIITPDGARIYGVRNGLGEAKSAIFIVHGLNGYMHEYAFKRAADHFQDQYDVYRFNLYDGRDGGRALIDCTISQHARDVQSVLDHFAPKYTHIFLIGHSYGGPVIMMANPKNIRAVSLWDPSYDLARLQNNFAANYIEINDYYIMNWGTSVLISKEMYRESARLNDVACDDLAKKFQAPVQVIHAGNGCFINDIKSYHSFGHAKNTRDIIPGTQHSFHEGNSCDKLLKKTQIWFESIV